MATITLKNIPADLHRKLKKRAEEHHRSLNKEIIATLKATTGKTHRVDVKALVREARVARAKFARQISEAEINAWKRAGRLRLGRTVSAMFRILKRASAVNAS
jgi:plasmid stability protein